MSFFKKNPNEVNYTGGKKHFIDVIKNTGGPENLIWLNGEEDFNTNSTLIVAESEDALFYKDGIVEQVFTGGRYQLSTNNYPFISRLRNLLSGGISSFNCKVYFVRKASSIEILWGTDTPIQLRDPVQMIATSVRARGALKIAVSDSKKFLIRLIGNNVQSLTNDGIGLFFRNEYLQHIKSTISRFILESKKEVLEVCAHQDMLAEEIEKKIKESLNEYGIELLRFSISSVEIPEDDPNRQKLEDAFAQKRLMDVMGRDWERQQSAEILKTFANNPGQDGIASLGAGLSFGMAAGNVVGNMAQKSFENLSGINSVETREQFIICPTCNAKCKASAKFCNECGTKIEKANKFCSECGTKIPPDAKFCNNCGAAQ